MIELPTGSTAVGLFFFYFLYPFRWLIHWTMRIMDSERNPIAKLSTAYASVFACLCWLVIGSYAMVASLERLAELMNIPAALVGVTVSAAGTSLPNYVASRIAAERGFGNMAVSNAFGSNTFNIMVGLGAPWLLYTSFVTGFQPYHGLRDEGIVESVLILASILLVFVVVVLHSGFVLYRWHGNLLIGLFVAYIACVVASVYIV
jgi:Ca2+/Na+ antiporter